MVWIRSFQFPPALGGLVCRGVCAVPCCLLCPLGKPLILRRGTSSSSRCRIKKLALAPTFALSFRQLEQAKQEWRLGSAPPGSSAYARNWLGHSARNSHLRALARSLSAQMCGVAQARRHPTLENLANSFFKVQDWQLGVLLPHSYLGEMFIAFRERERE